MAAIRAIISGDAQQYEQHCEMIEQAKGWRGFNALLAAAFTLAVRRRFREGFTVGGVIQLVASERVRVESPEYDIDPWVAERLMFAALGAGSPEGVDEEAAGFTQAALLAALVADEDFDKAGMDEFLAQARKTADLMAQM